MPDTFQYDVFLSHGSKDKAVMRTLAERLRATGGITSNLDLRLSDFGFPPPLRLDDAPIKASQAQFLYINWLPANREYEYSKLLEACGQQLSPEQQRCKLCWLSAGDENNLRVAE